MIIMKIYLPIISGKSGSDVFTWNLANGLKEAGVFSEVRTFPPLSGMFPPLLRFSDKPGECDIAHANIWNGFMFKQDIPLIVTEHTAIFDPKIKQYKSQGQKLYHRQIRRSEEKTLNVADTIVCVSSYCKKILENQFGAPCDKVIYNGIDPSFFKKRDDLRLVQKKKDNEKITIFFAGNHTRMKGFDLVLQIASQLKGVAKVIISSGLKKNCVEKLSSNIMSVGTLSKEEMLYYYNTCDIYLFPTHLEGCSLTVAEAMACEMPIIASNCASLPEQVDNSSGGFLSRMDDVDEFVRNIQYLAQDEEMRHKMGKYNRKKVLSKFTLSIMVKEYKEEYQRLLV